jgi:hypothetical protein
VSEQDQEPTEAAAAELNDELARKYDPERMLRMVSRRAGKGERLDHALRAKYEKQFGVDLGHVRIYTGEFAEEFNKKHNAYAVTIGSTGMILMGGSPDRATGTAAGNALLAHELTHVAQARRGLYRSAYSGETPFASEHDHEDEARDVEAAALGHDHAGADTHAATEAASAALAAREALARMIEQVKARAMELVADATHAQIIRTGGPQRRA